MMETKSRWFWMLLLIAILSAIPTDACWEHERMALLHLKPFFNYYNDLNTWVEMKGYSNSSSNSFCCEWERVECNSITKRVISLSLNSTRYWIDQIYLNGSLFLPFGELKSLYLSHNGIAGFVENEGFTQLLSNLETLDLSGNRLNNSIFSSFVQLTSSSSLRYLDLSMNNFMRPDFTNESGSKWFSRLNNLETLYLDENHFENDIFIHLNNLYSLKSLSLRASRLYGISQIHELNNLTNLKYLDLSMNRIESFLPTTNEETQVLKLVNLEELDLSSNRLRSNTFDFLDVFSNLTNLKLLSVEDNLLEGSMDVKRLNNLINLRKLYLSFNNIESFQSFGGNGRQARLDHLEELQLSSNLVNNTGLASLTQLPKLKYLDISGNKLKGIIDIRKDLGAFTNLEELDMSNNYELNEFVVHEGVLTSLKTLYLSYCRLSGMLVNKGFCNLKNLEDLDISGNAFEGIVPSCWGNLTSLRYLSLSNNNLQIPLSFSPLTNLSHLKVLLIVQNKLIMEPPAVGFHASLPKFQLYSLVLSNCSIDQQQLMKEPLQYLYNQHLSYSNFSGSLPTWLLKNNPNLKALFLMSHSFTGPLFLPPFPNLHLSYIDLSHNKIQGQVPTDMCSAFPYLKHLFLYENELEGGLPSCLGDMRALTILDLSSNQLSGGIPEKLTLNGPLKVLRLSNNNLSGEIDPQMFTSNSALIRLYLDGNNFVDEMPDIDISTLNMKLRDIDLSNNNLSGELPRWIWNLSNLEKLALSNNHFEGHIAIELCNLVALRKLDLSHNNLSGSIPSCFNPPSIIHVHLKGNKLSGPLIESLPKSSSLVTLDLSENNFIGNIPEWVDNLSTLSILILKGNLLDGGIPIQICKLYSLSILDLSKNMFSGTIPSCLGDLNLATRSFAKMVTNIFSYSIDGDESIKPLLTGLNGVGRIAVLQPNIHYPVMEESVEFTTKSNSYLYEGDILNYMTGIDLSCNKLTGHIPFELGNLSEIHALNLSHNNLIQVIPSSISNLKQIESLDLSYNNLSGKIPTQLVELSSLEVFSVAHNNLSGHTPERKAQFGTFDESSYEGNPLLCGLPLHNNCSHSRSQPFISITSNVDEEDGFLDTYVFCVTFLVCYVIVLLVIFVVLCINPYWRRRWFFFIEGFIDTCGYSVVGNTFALRIFKRNV